MTLNSDNPWPSLKEAKSRVLHIQQKLHRWSQADPEKRFHDLFNLVHDRATLLVAWHRVKSNRGSKTAGIDGTTRWEIEHRVGVSRFLETLRSDLKQRRYRPLPVREKSIPKRRGKTRRLGIPAIRDRVVQMALKLLLEPIFEADFCPTSYGYRPARRTQDAIAEIVRFINPRCSYNYVVEGDIEACFDNVQHTILMSQVRQRISDRKVNALVKAFLRSGLIQQNGEFERTLTGTPQGGILSPLLANIYLSALDRHFERAWQVQTRCGGSTWYYRKQGHAAYRMIRFADDFVILVRGARTQAENIRDEVARLLQDELSMKLSMEKTSVTNVEEGFDFLGFRIIRVPWKGKHVAWTYPSKRSLANITRKIKKLTCRSTTNLSLAALLHQLNPVLRGWTNYFRYAASKRTFNYLGHFTWWRVYRWLRKKHRRRSWRYLKKRYCLGGWLFQESGVQLFQASSVKVRRYRSRGYRIRTPWMPEEELADLPHYARSADDEQPRLEWIQTALITSA